MVKYNKDVIKVLKQSEKEMYELKNSSINIDHFILGTLKLNNNIRKILNKYEINYTRYKNKVKKSVNNLNNNLIFYSLNFKKILDLSHDTASRYQSSEIKLEHIFLTILDENIELNILKELDLNLENFYKDIIESTNNSNSIVFDIGIDLTELAKNRKLSKIIGRNNEIKQLIEILARKNKNNPILIGEAGVGKTAIVEELANMISYNDVPNFLKNKKIISINFSSIISGTKYRGEFEEKLNKLLKECENRDDIILFIDEIHTIVGAGGAEGAIDASNILKPSLARSSLKLIGATTLNEYKKTIAIDKALDRRFQKILVDIPTKEETYKILKSIKSEYEKYHNVIINDNVLKSIINLSDKYILDRNNPDKSIDILDEACANTNVIKSFETVNNLNRNLLKTKLKKEESIKNKDYDKALNYKKKEQSILERIDSSINLKKRLTIETVINIIESKCNSKVYEIESGKIFEDLKFNLNKKIIGQESEINSIIDKLKILSNKNDNLPISILINGPSGTGKTLFATELSKLLNRNLIKLNMSDYENDTSLNRIIGSPQGYIGYDDNNTVFEDLKIHPNSIILLDGIDKANPHIINLFSQIFETGIIKNSKNEIINFKNTIFIITSGYNQNVSIGYINNNQNECILSNELISKINYVTNFKKLTKNSIKKIIFNYLDNFNNTYSTDIALSNKDIESILSKNLNKECDVKKVITILRNHLEDLLLYKIKIK